MLEIDTGYSDANHARCFVVRQMQTRVLPTAQQKGEGKYPNQLSSLFKSGMEEWRSVSGQVQQS